MPSYRRFRQVVGALLLIAATLAGAGLHHHEDLARYAAGADPGALSGRVVSNHSPLSKSSHWHSVLRVQEHACLACHHQRFAAIAARAHDPAPSQIRLFVSHVSLLGPALSLRLCDPTRGPPSLS